MSLTKTNLYKNLTALREEYLNRIEGTHLPAWKAHWQQELLAVQRALAALEDQV